MRIHAFLKLAGLSMALWLSSSLLPAWAQTDCSQVEDISQGECEALLDLYNSTDGPNWSQSGGWNENNTPCDWDRVLCLPATLSTVNLVSLRLMNNKLSGSIPDSIGNLINLTSLDLSENELSGPIPNSLGNLTSLGSLRLSENRLSGSIPNTLSILTNLEVLYLDNNQLSGSIPDSFGVLTSLNELALVRNQLSGQIPESLGNLSNLRFLFLSENVLTGSIPNSFSGSSTFPNLLAILLDYNNLSGPIPSDFHLISSGNAVIRLENNNCLTAPDTGALRTFLDTNNPDWETQNCTIADLGIDPATLPTFDAAQVATLDPEILAAFRAEDLAALPANALQGLSPAQLAQVPPDTLNGLTPAQFSNLPSATLGRIDGRQLGGLPVDVLRNAMPAQINNLNATRVQTNERNVLRLLTNVDTNQVQPADVMDLLPADWDIDMNTGELTVPPGTPLSLRSMSPPASLPTNLTLPDELPDLNSSLGLGGEGGETVLDGLRQSLADAGITDVTLSQNAQGVLVAEGTGSLSGARLSFTVDDALATQTTPGSADSVGVLPGNQIALTTPGMQQFPLIPAAQDPAQFAGLLAAIDGVANIGTAGDVNIALPADTFASTGTTGGARITVLFDSVVIPDTGMAPGIYLNTPGLRAGVPIGQVVYGDGSAQQIYPYIPAPQVFRETAIKAFAPFLTDIVFNQLDGTATVFFDGGTLTLIPQSTILNPGNLAPTITVNSDLTLDYLVKEKAGSARVLSNIAISP